MPKACVGLLITALSNLSSRDCKVVSKQEKRGLEREMTAHGHRTGVRQEGQEGWTTALIKASAFRTQLTGHQQPLGSASALLGHHSRGKGLGT